MDHTKAALPQTDERREAELDRQLLRDLVAILSHHNGERGDNEGAVDVLNRIIRERDRALSADESQKRKGVE